MELSPPALLAFVEDCDLTDAEDQQQAQARADVRRQSLGSCTSSCTSERETRSRPRRDTGSRPRRDTGSRPRRDVVDIVALKSQIAALALELSKLKAARRGGGLALESSHWQIESQRQSLLRTAAQEENERLRTQMQVQTQIAKRLTNLLKRNPFNQMLRIVQTYELEAKERAERTETNLDEDLEQAYLQTDIVLFKAEMYSLPPVFYDEQIRWKHFPEGLSIEFRRSLRVPYDLNATSAAYWAFIPGQGLKKGLRFGHNVTAQNDSVSSVFLFQSTNGLSQTQFNGQYLLRRYVTAERVVLVWKTLLQSALDDTSSRLQLHGQGWFVIQSASSTDDGSTPSTSVLTFAQYDVDTSARVFSRREQMQQNAELRVLIEYVTSVMEKYGAFPAHMARLYNGVRGSVSPLALMATSIYYNITLATARVVLTMAAENYACCPRTYIRVAGFTEARTCAS